MGYWEKISGTNIAYFHFTTVWVSDTTSNKELYYLCVIKSIQEYNLRGCNVGITDGRIYEVRRWDGLRSYVIRAYVHTKFHKDLFKL
jgi:hypothetical protein